MDFLERRYDKSFSMVFRKVADEFILVPIRDNAGDLGSIYTLNSVGARIWELVDGAREVSEIRDVLVDEFEVTQEQAEKDLVRFLRQMESIEAVVLSA